VQSSFQFYIALIWDANLTEDKEKVKLSQSVNSLRQNIHKNFLILCIINTRILEKANHDCGDRPLHQKWDQ
jgi:hypothetical protein